MRMQEKISCMGRVLIAADQGFSSFSAFSAFFLSLQVTSGKAKRVSASGSANAGPPAQPSLFSHSATPRDKGGRRRSAGTKLPPLLFILYALFSILYTLYLTRTCRSTSRANLFDDIITSQHFQPSHIQEIFPTGCAPNMPKSLAKVHKKISKKTKGNISSLHENSRDSQRLRRAGARDDKLARLSKARSKANQPHSQCWSPVHME